MNAERLLLCLIVAICPWAQASDSAPAVVTLDHAEAVLQPDGLPDQQRRVELQHRWDQDFPGRGGSATYTLQLPPIGPSTSSALFFGHVGNQASIRINGITVQQLGTLGDASLDAGKSSQMIIVPSALLLATRSNELVIEATMQPLRAGGLAPVRFGPSGAIESMYERQRLLDQSASTAYAVSLLLMGGLAAGLWWRQRDPLYGCFSLAALFGVLRHMDHLSQAIPVPWPLWGAVLAIGYGCQLGLIARFVVLVLDRNPVWLVRAIYAVLGMVTVLASLSFWLLIPALWTGAGVLLELLGLACFGVVLHEAIFGQRGGIAWLVLGAGSLLLLAGAHDILLVRMGLLGGSSLALAPHAMFFFVLILAGLVVARYSRSVADYRALNEHLSERVAERERQLGDAFEALRTQQQEQAVLSERQRIMREIHDGIGSQLVGLLNMVSQPQADKGVLEEQVRLALDEMRMAVDSLQPVHSDLTTVLATLRYRLQPRLQAAGIEVVWDVSALPPMSELSPQSTLQVQRILLEAFTNVLKHARATRVAVQARRQDGDGPAVVLKLSDNGVGFAPEEPAGASRGYGVSNMRARASAIGASLDIEAVPGGGTCVVLVWPLRPSEHRVDPPEHAGAGGVAALPASPGNAAARSAAVDPAPESLKIRSETKT